MCHKNKWKLVSISEVHIIFWTYLFSWSNHDLSTNHPNKNHQNYFTTWRFVWGLSHGFSFFITQQTRSTVPWAKKTYWSNLFKKDLLPTTNIVGLTCWIVRLFQPFFWDTGNPCYISTNTKKVWQNQNLFPRWALQVWGNQPSLFPPVLPHFFLGYPNNHPRRSVSCQHFDGLDLRWPTWSCCSWSLLRCWANWSQNQIFQLNIWLIMRLNHLYYQLFQNIC